MISVEKPLCNLPRFQEAKVTKGTVASAVGILFDVLVLDFSFAKPDMLSCRDDASSEQRFPEGRAIMMSMMGYDPKDERFPGATRDWDLPAEAGLDPVYARGRDPETEFSDGQADRDNFRAVHVGRGPRGVVYQSGDCHDVSVPLRCRCRAPSTSDLSREDVVNTESAWNDPGDL